ncbi:N-acyl amino acid synthase, PEP-CTERM/exosortase system-associated [Nitrosomonas eutropha]|uniref:N-acyl amino acid synthase, PEP-CTERM/exosortase system-associated n=1 Tax=Nitrosomonas eutropha TaxID=916 RepID=A0A1I7G1S3_9PROT|nr:PEP-CTERM/exosortase system-associated acyltransferase [Nitrosomonas eutropha]SFU42271.1 N-acyl amino acid synthase, PEP-CTERM/exosortase system-associated [Nitrosomonas eutropha]
MKHMNNLEAAFHQYFEIVHANTPELLKEAFSLRFRVLCVHNDISGFNSVNYPNKLESDEYDSRSVHLLLRHRPTDTFIGTTRLILPDSQHPENKLPTELHTRFYPEFQVDPLSRKHTAEISRFAISSNFFKRKNEHYTLAGPVDIPTRSVDKPQERRHFPHPMLALVVGIIQICAQYEIYHLLSSMEPALNKLLGFYGLQLNAIGPSTDYHGLRSPYHVCLLDVLDRIYRNQQVIWELVTDHGNIWPADLTFLRQQNRLQPVGSDSVCIPG